MARYRVVCTVQNPCHLPNSLAHIVQVGTGSDAGWNELLTVHQVYERMNRGDTFYTLGDRTDWTAEVHPFECRCGAGTLRSSPDATTDNNLDSLNRCRV